MADQAPDDDRLLSDRILFEGRGSGDIQRQLGQLRRQLVDLVLLALQCILRRHQHRWRGLRGSGHSVGDLGHGVLGLLLLVLSRVDLLLHITELSLVVRLHGFHLVAGERAAGVGLLLELRDLVVLLFQVGRLGGRAVARGAEGLDLVLAIC